MNKRVLLKIFGITLITLAIGSTDTFGSPEIKPATIDPLREALAGRAPFPSTVDMKPLEILYENLSTLDQSRCPVDAIINLKNPFATALPEPERPVEIVKQPPVDVKQQLLPPPVSDKGGQPVPVPKPNFQVQGLVWDSDLPEAIVNNEVVSIGDKINGWTVIEINPQGVKMGIDTTNVYWFSP